MDNIVISGIGVVSPVGFELNAYRQALNHAMSAKMFGGHRIPDVEIDLDKIPHGLSPRQTKKLDRFTILSIYATRAALRDGKYNLTDGNNDRLGLLMGNAFGGWSYVEEQMYSLCQNHYDAINSYVATAWFPAAPQGEISILDKIAGASKTFSAGGLSSAYAIEYGVDLIKSGKLDAAVAGGTESPTNPIVNNAMTDFNTRTRFGQSFVAESAGMVLIESEKSAKARAATIYAKIEGFAYHAEPEAAIHQCLQQCNVQRDDVGYMIAPSGLTGMDIPTIHFDQMTGYNMGADFCLNVVNTCLIMQFESESRHHSKHYIVMGHDDAYGYLCLLLTRAH